MSSEYDNLCVYCEHESTERLTDGRLVCSYHASSLRSTPCAKSYTLRSRRPDGVQQFAKFSYLSYKVTIEWTTNRDEAFGVDFRTARELAQHLNRIGQNHDVEVRELTKEWAT